MQTREFEKWLHAGIVSAYGMENETWAVEKVRRVIWKLNKARRGKPKLEVEVLGIRAMTAFILPGRHVYISRRLLERCTTDAEVAMVLAHEAAHLDLEHLEAFAGWARRFPRIGGSWFAASLFRKAEQWLHSEEQEHAADRRGLELCVKAGFDQRQCLSLFDTLRASALDYGDLDAVFGVDEDELEPEDGAIDRLLLRARASISKLGRSHPPIDDRKSRLKALIPA